MRRSKPTAKPSRLSSQLLAVALAVAVLAGCDPIPPSSTGPNHPRGGCYGPLRVEGAALLGADGAPVQLRGLSSHGLAWFPQYVNEDAMRQMKEDWGCNVFRLAMYTGEDGYCYAGEEDREELEDLIDSAVQIAADLGMYIIVDWHILEDGNPLEHLEDAVSFFSEKAERYARMDHVLFEICNEPNGDATWDDVEAYAGAVIPAIREHSDAVVLVGTPEWSQRIDLPKKEPLEGFGNIMYTYHFYAASHGAGERARLKEAVTAGVPVFVSECGICAYTGDGEINETEAECWFDLMDSLGVSYVMWNLSNKDESAAFLVGSCQKTSGFTYADLSRSGQWFLRHIADN